MKTIFGFLNAGLLLAAVAFTGASSGFAQDVCSETEAQTKLQDTIRETYAKDKKTALETGKQLLEKYGSCQFSAEFVAWLKPQMPKWEQSLKAAADAEKRAGILKRFDTAVTSKNYDEAYAAGNDFVAQYPNDPTQINIILPLGLIGLYQSYPPAKNYKFNDQAIKYANMTIAKLKAGDPGIKKNKAGIPVYGVFEFEMTKDDALSELTYALAYINFWAKGDKKAALPYYYQAIQMPGRNKDNPNAYATIAGYYADEAGRLGKEYAELVKTRNESDAPDVAAEKEKKIKEAEGMLKGYLDRAIDAYIRAWKAAPTTDRTNKDNLYKAVQDLYKARYQKTDGLDALIASTTAKPMPDPTSTVTPVVEAEPTPNTTTGAPAATVTKPVSMTTTARVSDNQVGAAAPKTKTSAAGASKPAAAKKAAPKKKGTR